MYQNKHNIRGNSCTLLAIYVNFLLLFFFIAVVQPFSLSGQGQKKMTSAEYDKWYKIKNQALDAKGNTLIYALEKETGDKLLGVVDIPKDTTYFFSRTGKAAVDRTGDYVVFAQSLSWDSTRTLKRKKTPKDKMPADSLVIFDKKTGNAVKIAGLTDFSLSEKWPGYCFYTVKWPKTDKTEKKDTSAIEKNEKKTAKKKPVCEEPNLVIRHLASGKEDTIPNVREYTLAKNVPVLAYIRCMGDSTATFRVNMYDVVGGKTSTIADSLVQASQLAVNHDGQQASFLALLKKSEEVQKPYQLLLYMKNDSSLTNLTQRHTEFLPQTWLVSADRKPSFTESGNRLLFGMCPLRPVKDTIKLDDEIVNVEIWHHDSPRLYTQMEASMDSDKKKSYAAMYDIRRDTFYVLETAETDRSVLSEKGDGRFVMQLRSRPYEKSVTWLGETLKDIFLLDTENGTSMQIATAESGSPSFSPAGKYIYWWSKQDSIWKTFDTRKKTLGVLGLWSVSAFQDEENDVPEKAGPYGIAGWLRNDTAAIVYDRYDLWKLNPEDPFTNICMTDGRMHKNVFRLIDTDKENDYIDTSGNLLLHRFNESNKGEAYYRHSLGNGQNTKLVGGNYSLSKNVVKADSTQLYLFSRQDFATFPDVLMADSSFATEKKLTNANPQQGEYGWGNARLYSWTNYRGTKNEGLLILPPDFNPEKKYPLIVNFYERSSDELHRYRAPEAHRSTINYAYYANLGYVIFNPDIKYLTGQPGEDCYNAVESGVESLLRERFIDESRIGLQGHSWGGYQVAYLLGKSDRYRCAEAGAPVVNMVSAYGGIRWESGMSRMFQYEKQQSRLGATLWENKELYHKNSPIYDMPNVNTPVLIMHNDEDGAVPWYQGIEYFMALRRLGKPTWLLNYNGEPHWPVKWQNRLDFNIRMEQFFNHYLMDGPMPLWMKEGNTPLEKGILDKY